MFIDCLFFSICLFLIIIKCMLLKFLLINDLYITDEVMELHYNNKVGLIPLSATVHDMVHNSYMFIPINKVRGFYRPFIESYYNHINPDLLDAIDAAEQATKEELDKKRMELFNNHRIYVNVDGSYALPEKDRIKGDIRNHIADLKSNSPSGTNKTMCVIVKDK